MIYLEYILLPFTFIIEQIFLFSHQLTGNYGLSIVLLSFIISLGLLPIFIIIEKAKKRNDAIRQRMKPVADEIKRSYKGQERYYYIKTLNRQHGYSPTKALIPVLSLLIQIPFFIAVFQFLGSYEPLVGKGFLFINDLSAPDGLFGSVNILPILMTLVNLVTAYLYTRGGSQSERNQMLAIAGVFLLLLFNLPSGLVLYWTMNNVFSFFRLFITNPEVFTFDLKKHFEHLTIKSEIISIATKLRIPFLFITAIAILTQLNWAINKTFAGFGLRVGLAIIASIMVTLIIGLAFLAYNLFKEQLKRLVIKPSIFYSLLFLSVYFFLSAKFYFTGVNTNINILSLGFLIPLQAIGLFYYIQTKSNSHPSLFNLAGLLLFILSIVQVLNLIVFFSKSTVSFTFAGINLSVENSSLADIVLPGLLFSLITLPFYTLKHNLSFPKPPRLHWVIYLISLLYISGMIFFWNPLLAYSTSPETFTFPAVNIIYSNFGLFLASTLIPVLIYLVLPIRVKQILLFFILLLISSSFIFSTLLPLELGSLQVTRFSEESNLAAPIAKYLLESMVLIGLFITILWALNKKLVKPILGILIALNIATIAQSLYLAYDTGKFYKTGREIEYVSTDTEPMKALHFSKEHQNIVYFIADGFQGWFINQIMEEEPHLRELFHGFTWYPNTLSMANYTHASLPSMLGGYKYCPESMNKDTLHTIAQKMRMASREFIERTKSLGYKYSSEHKHYKDFEDNLVDFTIPYWHGSWDSLDEKVPLSPSREIWYRRLFENAIFNSVPLCFKSKIYNNGEWLAHYQKREDPSRWVLSWYNFIRILPLISCNESDQPNFIYIHNSATHNPWNIVDDNGRFIHDVSPFENNKWAIIKLGEWIRWMQDNDVYNNTKILLISDHGPSWNLYKGRARFNSPHRIDKDNPNLIDDRRFWRLNALLMVKNFDSQEPLKTDWRLMNTADAPAIIFEKNDHSKTDSTSRTLNAYWTFWASRMIENKTMVIDKKYEINDNMYDLKNWKVIN